MPKPFSIGTRCVSGVSGKGHRSCQPERGMNYIAYGSPHGRWKKLIDPDWRRNPGCWNSAERPVRTRLLSSPIPYSELVSDSRAGRARRTVGQRESRPENREADARSLTRHAGLGCAGTTTPGQAAVARASELVRVSQRYGYRLVTSRRSPRPAGPVGERNAGIPSSDACRRCRDIRVPPAAR